jgi:hypothetical protein
MDDYFAFQSEDLFFSKLMVIGIIHTILSFIVLEGALRQSRRYVFFFPARFFVRLLSSPYHRGGGSIIIGTAVAVLSSVGASQIGPQTLLVVNAGFLTIWYIECAILLTDGFFARLFENELPFEIRLFVSFVVMVNAGYFTLMFIVSLLRAPAFH